MIILKQQSKRDLTKIEITTLISCIVNVVCVNHVNETNDYIVKHCVIRLSINLTKIAGNVVLLLNVVEDVI